MTRAFGIASVPCLFALACSSGEPSDRGPDPGRAPGASSSVVLPPASAASTTSGSQNPSGMDALDARSFCSTVFAARGAHLARSCSPDDKKRLQHQTLARRARDAERACEAALEGPMERGRVVAPMDRAKRCADALLETSWKEALGARYLPSTVEACRDVLVGSQGEGQPCQSDVECRLGFWCQAVEEGFGRCALPRSEGESCRPPMPGVLRNLAVRQRCEDGLACSLDPSALAGADAEARERYARLARSVSGGRSWPGALGLDESLLTDAPLPTGQDLDWSSPHASSRPSVRYDQIEITGELSQEAVEHRMRTALSGFRVCYLGALKKQAELDGSVVLSFDVDADGKAIDGAVARSTLGTTEIDACLLAVLATVRFPPPSGSVRVRYGLVLDPGADAKASASSPSASSSVGSVPSASVAPPSPVQNPGSAAEPVVCRPGEPNGLRALGEACELDEECAPGTFCDDTLCAPERPTGADCTRAAECKGLCLQETCAAFCGAG